MAKAEPEIVKESQNIWQQFGMFFYTRFRYTTLLWLFLVGFGLLSYTTLMRREGFPTVNAPIGIITVVAFDETAEKVDASYALPITEVLRDNENVKSVNSVSTDKGSTLVVTFEEGTNVASELVSIEQQVGTRNLPESSRIIYTKLSAGKLTNEGDDILVSVYGDNLSVAELDKASQEVARELQEANSPLIERVKALEQLQTAPSQTDVSMQTVQTSFDRYFDDSMEQVQPAAVVAIKGVQDVDQLELYDEVSTLLENIHVAQPEAEVAISADFAEGIREQIGSLQRNLLEGLVVVLLVSFVLISLRASIITALAMATTVIITVGVLYAIGYTLNTITLFSLVLCLALIVDDTTIIIEAIDAGLRDKKKSLSRVVRESLRKVARASTTGTIVTMFAFAPMLFISGILGDFIRAIPVTIIISLATSLLVSIMFIPLMMKYSFFGKVSHKPRRFQGVDRAERAIGNILAKTILWSDARGTRRKFFSRLTAVLVGIGFFVAGIFIFSRVGFNIFPNPKDGNDIVISVQMNDVAGATFETTEAFTDELLASAKSTLGSDLHRLSLSAQGSVPSASEFTVSVKLSDLKSRYTTSVEYSEKLKQSFLSYLETARIEARPAGVGPPSSAFAIRLRGENPEQLRSFAAELQAFLQTAELKRPDGSIATFKDVDISPSVVALRSVEDEFIQVTAVFSDDDTSALVSLAQDAVKNEFNDEELRNRGLAADTIEFDLGQEQENQDSFSSMGTAALPLFICMFVVMAILFRSLLQPLLIFTALPFAVFGVALGLYLTDNVISFFSMLGVFALIGISLNNTILLTDYANESQRKGRKPAQAMAEALRARLRPLLTTSVTSVLALLPLAISDPFWEGLAYTLMFGLISSTLLVISVFPYYYLIAEWLRSLVRFKKHKRA